jgi:hypothetical protein
MGFLLVHQKVKWLDFSFKLEAKQIKKCKIKLNESTKNEQNMP